MRVQSFFRPPAVVIVLKPEVLWVGGDRIGFSAVQDWTRVLSEAEWKGKEGVEILPPLRGEEHSGDFVFRESTSLFPRGFGLIGRLFPPAALSGLQRRPADA